MHDYRPHKDSSRDQHAAAHSVASKPQVSNGVMQIVITDTYLISTVQGALGVSRESAHALLGECTRPES